MSKSIQKTGTFKQYSRGLLSALVNAFSMQHQAVTIGFAVFDELEGGDVAADALEQGTTLLLNFQEVLFFCLGNVLNLLEYVHIIFEISGLSTSKVFWTQRLRLLCAILMIDMTNILKIIKVLVYLRAWPLQVLLFSYF